MKLLAALLLIPAVSFGAYDNNYQAEIDAKQAIAEAMYKQSGAEDSITKYIDTKIPNSYKPILSKVTTAVTALINKKVEARWYF